VLIQRSLLLGFVSENFKRRERYSPMCRYPEFERDISNLMQLKVLAKRNENSQLAELRAEVRVEQLLSGKCYVHLGKCIVHLGV